MVTLAFWIDVDNTLIANDDVKRDWDAHLQVELGPQLTARRVLIYEHKQQHLQEIMQQYPADHYVIIDDRPDILANAKSMLGDRLTTVFVKQGKYAAGPMPANFTPDIVVSHIADLRNYSAEQFAGSHNR